MGSHKQNRKFTQMKWKFCWWKTNLNLTKMINKPHKKKTNRHETPVLDHPIKIIYVDNDLVVLDKPCSLPVSRIPQTQKAPTRITKKAWNIIQPDPTKNDKKISQAKECTQANQPTTSRGAPANIRVLLLLQKKEEKLKTRNQTRSSWKMWKFNMKHEPNIWMTFHVCCKQWDLLLLLSPNRAHPQTLLQFALCAYFFWQSAKITKEKEHIQFSVQRNWTFSLTFPTLTCHPSKIVSMHLFMFV